ncbi:dethiobiotin synthase [Planctomicrobium piriforme]|uniref:ATP-dependent dethiobiotin synthetase BioD n=1 Tax=Planctomicrobium piriforme TaxID=1576369 RepID=A0A1I3JIV2_9PLAN|nr:dethiobiotin synthase [Planctomicrobium piriforme]SFI59918.1 dethiobiotin synthetase [Planctomicrobium piriforme]
MTSGLFITGTDTGVGKTHVTCQLAGAMVEMGLRVGAYKPVCSGAEVSESGKLHWGDVEQIWNALGGRYPRELICPQTFHAAVAPPVAAKMEKRSVDSSLLRAGAAAWHDKVDCLLVEGAGGWFSPIADGETVSDLARDLRFPVVIVSANRLGMINHTLLTILAVRQAGLPIAGIVENCVQSAMDESAATNIGLLQELTDVPVFGPWPWFPPTDLLPPHGFATMRQATVDGLFSGVTLPKHTR